MALAEMAEGYQIAHERLSGRIAEIKAQLLAGDDPELRSELHNLMRVDRELRSVRDICANYYERSYHPDEQYTAQYSPNRVLRRAAKVAGGNRRNKRGNTRETQKAPAQSNPGGIDSAATAVLADALLRPKNYAGDRRRTRSRQINGFQNPRKSREKPLQGTEVLPVKGEPNGKRKRDVGPDEGAAPS